MAMRTHFIDTARIVCGEGFMELSGVRPSVCPTHNSAAARRGGGFAAVGPAARRCRSIAARPTLTSRCEQCHVVSRRRKLETDSFVLVLRTVS